MRRDTLCGPPVSGPGRGGIVSLLMIYSEYVSKGIVGIQKILVLLGGIPVYYLMLWYKKPRGTANVFETR
jgi:hypothetical protein